MTISMAELIQVLSKINPRLEPAPRPAFITEAAFSVGDAGYAAVVTAEYIDRSSGTFEITLDALGYTGPAPISVTINEKDIRAVREMLGIGNDVACRNPDESDLTAKLLGKALKTLRVIADLDQEKSEPADSWREVLFRTIEIAQHTVDHIESDAAQAGLELADGTASDS